MIVYMIKSAFCGRVYIGQSIRKSINLRWIRHKHDLKKGVHSNKDLQKCYNEHGVKNLSYSILEVIEKEDRDLLHERESYWINFFKSNNEELGFNKTTGGQRCRVNYSVRKAFSEKRKGYKQTAEWIRNSANARRGLPSPLRGRVLGPRPQEVRMKISSAKTGIKVKSAWKKVSSANVDSGAICRFESLGSASLETGVSPTRISSSCARGGYANGFVFIYSSENESADNEKLHELILLLRSKLAKSKLCAHHGGDNHNSRKVINNVTGEIYFTIKEAAEKNSFNYSTLKCKLNGGLKNDTHLSKLSME